MTEATEPTIAGPAAQPPDQLTFYGLDGRKVAWYTIASRDDFVVDTVGDGLPMQIGRVEFRRGRKVTPPIPR